MLDNSPLLYRCDDPKFWNSIANHPDVRPYIGDERDDQFGDVSERGLWDCAPAFKSGQGLFGLANAWGGFLLLPMKDVPGCLELHTMFVRQGRGKLAIQAAEDLFTRIFSETVYDLVVTICPEVSPGSLWLAKHVGMIETGEDIHGTGMMMSAEMWRKLKNIPEPPGLN